MWFKCFPKRLNSKKERDRLENPKKIKVVACNKCHNSGITLYKGKDSYYCKDCMNKLKKKQEKHLKRLNYIHN